MIKARELKRGDIFRIVVDCEVLKASPIASGKRIKVVAAVENPIGPIEYLDEGCTLALVCTPGRQFAAYRPRRDDDGGADFVVNPPDPAKLVDA
jgi:hypothetical protein